MKQMRDEHKRINADIKKHKREKAKCYQYIGIMDDLWRSVCLWFCC